jgi:hypothetical protein
MVRRACSSCAPNNIHKTKWILFCSLKNQCCGSGSGMGFFLTPGFGIRNRFFPDPGSQDHIYKSFLTIFFLYISLKIGPNFFLKHLKAKIIYNLAVLWIRINFLRIRIQGLMLETNTDPDTDPIQYGSRALMTKNWKKITAENFIYFLIKLQFTYP